MIPFMHKCCRLTNELCKTTYEDDHKEMYRSRMICERGLSDFCCGSLTGGSLLATASFFDGNARIIIAALGVASVATGVLYCGAASVRACLSTPRDQNLPV